MGHIQDFIVFCWRGSLKLHTLKLFEKGGKDKKTHYFLIDDSLEGVHVFH